MYFVNCTFCYRIMDEENDNNPWDVQDLEEFLYFCCPECEEKNSSKELFVKHALDEHPKAKDKIEKLKIKLELDADENSIKNESYVDTIDTSQYYEMNVSVLEENHEEQDFEVIKSEIEKDFEQDTDQSTDLLKIEVNDIDISEENKTKKIVWDKDSEQELLVNLIESSGLKDLPFKSPIRKKLWIELTKKFNEATCSDRNYKYLSSKWANRYRWLKGSENNETIIDDIQEKEANSQKNEDLNDTNIDKIENCDICGDTFKNNNSLRNHKYIKHSKTFAERSKSCDICGKEFSSAITLKVHLNNVHEGENSDTTCNTCGKQYKNSKSLASHKYIAHSGKYFTEEVDCACNICGRTFRNNQHLRNHKYVIHSKTYAERPKCCHLCGKTFTTPVSLKVHIKNVHEGQKNYSCEQCGKTFTRHESLKVHIESIHEGIKKFICQICNHPWSSKKNLDVHVKTVHEKIKDQICELCGKAFGTASEVKKHKRNIHEGIRPYKCETCGKEFTLNKALQTHIQTVHEGLRNIKCKFCEKVYGRREHLRRHIITAHGGLKLKLKDCIG